MPAADRSISHGLIQKENRDILRSPRPKRLKNNKQRGSRTFEALGQLSKLCILSKPEAEVLNGKTRHRFPDPSQDKSILLGLFDKQQTLVKLHYIDHGGVNVDETLEKEIMKNPHGVHYFLKLEQVQIDHANGETEIETKLHSRSIICAKLSDHTITDTNVPDEVAGFWIRVFGANSTFTMNFTLWSAEVKKSNSHCLIRGNGANEDFYNLVKHDEIHVQFSNKQRQIKKQKKGRTKKKLENTERNVFEIKEIDSVIKKVRSIRDNGKVEEFNSKCRDLLQIAKKKGNLDEELVLLLEQSMCLCHQGNPSEGKKLLQKAVHMSSKSNNSTTIKNRAYLFLALIHINDGSFGTAQECLGMLENEVNSLLSIEDLAVRSMLYGIIMMNFGWKLKEMAKNLWKEAADNFENALSYCLVDENGIITEDLVCVIHLWMARLYLGMLKSSSMPGCKSPDLENKVIEHLNYFDDIEPVKLSRRTTINGLLLQGEYKMFLQHNEAACSIFDNVVELIAIDDRLYYLEIKALEKAKKEKEKDGEYDHNAELLEKTRYLLTKSDSDTGYGADESSSNEKVDLEAVRYKQTTYV